MSFRWTLVQVAEKVWTAALFRRFCFSRSRDCPEKQNPLFVLIVILIIILISSSSLRLSRSAGSKTRGLRFPQREIEQRQFFVTERQNT